MVHLAFQGVSPEKAGRPGRMLLPRYCLVHWRQPQFSFRPLPERLMFLQLAKRQLPLSEPKCSPVRLADRDFLNWAQEQEQPVVEPGR